MIRVILLEPDGWRFRGMWSVLRDSGEADILGDLDYGRVLSLTSVPEEMSADVIVIAHRLVLEYGLAMIPMLRDLFSPCAVLVHGEIESLDVTARLYAAGARGFFPLSSPPGLLAKAVRVVSEGKYWGPREAVALMAERVLAESDTSADPADGDEIQLLAFLSEGLSNKEIAQRLGLAEATIKARFNRLYKRFGVATRLQLLSTAIARGLIVPEAQR